MDRACILLLLTVGLLAISAADATKYVGGWPCPLLKCNEPPPVGNGLCPTVACTSAFAVAASGPRGCALVVTQMRARAISQSAYVADTDIDEEWKNYCKGNGDPKKNLAVFTKSVAEAFAKSVGVALVKYFTFWCTCGKQSLVYSYAEGQAVATAEAVAVAWASALAKVKTDTCNDPLFQDNVLAAAAADSYQVAEDVKLAIASLYKEYEKYNKAKCDSDFKIDIELAVAQAIACSISRAVIKTYNKFGESYAYGEVEAMSCIEGVAATSFWVKKAYFECKSLKCNW